MSDVESACKTHDIDSSRGDGVTSAFSKLRPIWISHLYYFFSKNGKIKMTKKMAKRNGHHWHQYIFPIESAFEYSHQLNRNESSNGFHILRSHFALTF